MVLAAVEGGFVPISVFAPFLSFRRAALLKKFKMLVRGFEASALLIQPIGGQTKGKMNA